jgi:hypothetical protein
MLAHLNLHNTIVKKHLVGGNGLDDEIERWFDSPFFLSFQAHFQTSKKKIWARFVHIDLNLKFLYMFYLFDFVSFDNIKHPSSDM